ncbi:MAG: hypothetical protein M1822_003632 [Bathelium mastoideum]|nr:MAG: hypothetical protein M1822_003632 [Bathelium mastoideum]
MDKPKPRALLFDIGGVCVVSPFQGILDFEKAHNIPSGWINYATSRAAPNGAWQRLERNELPLDATFFQAYAKDLAHSARWAAFLAQRQQKQQQQRQEQRNGYATTTTTTTTNPSPSLSSTPPPPPTINTQDLFNRMMAPARHPDPYMYPALQRLRRSGRFVLGALSNTVRYPADHPFHPSSTADEANPRVELQSCFDVFVSSAEVGMRKPEAGIYALALAELRDAVRAREGGREGQEEGKGGEVVVGGEELRAEEVVFLDDIGENLRAGREAGMRTIRVWLGRSEEAVRELEEITGMRLLEGKESSVVGGGRGGAKL